MGSGFDLAGFFTRGEGFDAFDEGDEVRIVFEVCGVPATTATAPKIEAVEYARTLVDCGVTLYEVVRG